MKKAETTKVVSGVSNDSLKEQVDALYKKFNMLLKVCERHFGEDINRDGFIGDKEVK